MKAKTGRVHVKTITKPQTVRVPIQGIDTLTLLQARAMLKASLAVLMRFDLNADDDTLTGRERESLAQAISKLDRCVRYFD